jgi:Flp pilus assembly protein TadG
MNALTNRLENVTSLIAHSMYWRIGNLAKDERGVSAVEFAMLLPLMLSLYLGAVEVSQGIAADRKVTLTARTVADLVSQVTSVNNSDMTNSLNAASAVMSPYPSGNLKVVVTSVKIDAQGKATVAWSDTLHGTARAKGATVTLPAALNVPNSSLIWSEVEYTYKPVIGYVVTGSMNLKDQIYMRPRMSDCVTREGVQTTCT